MWEPLTAPPETGYPWVSIPAAQNSGLFAPARHPSKWIDFLGDPAVEFEPVVQHG